jgi:lipopolysaccharide/colanic/teichoic acid biosynthesis glycosyltransferase/CheY-like chemotaxis protein
MKEILVTDNDFSTRDLILEYLQETNYSVVHAVSSLEEAVKKIIEKKPDLILLNKNLSDYENCECSFLNMRAKLDIPVIIIEKNGNSSNGNEFKKFTDHLYTPFEKEDLLSILDRNTDNNTDKTFKNAQIENVINECGLKPYYFIRNYLEILSPKSLIINTTSRFNLKIFYDREFDSLVNLKRINDIRYLNKFFETANELLPVNGIFIGCAETKGLRKKRILKKYPPVFNYIYYSLDFILKRVFPKLPVTKSIYFLLTQGHNRVLSKPEILGRLYSCGFEVMKEQLIDNMFYFVVKKVKNPVFDPNPTYGPVIKIRRNGKDGKIIKVYKFRTMHPYSEYLQEYMYRENKLASGGKFRNDFRVTTLGRFLRKFWLDELPMIYNLLKGDIKLVGVRPLSKQYFSLYPDDFKKIRIKYKPGLIPPFYKDLPKTFEEIIASEKEYIRQFEIHPIRTDIKYFFSAFYNILFKKARSK